MKYILTKKVIGPVPVITLTAEDFVSIEKARSVLANGLSMEEKYDLVISNYLDFEIALLDAAAQHMVRGEYTYEWFFAIRAQLNKKIVNLLTAARMFVDQLGRHVSGALPDDAYAKEAVRTMFSKEYDASTEYRFMEALRNSVQHFEFPVHWTEFPSSWDSTTDDGGNLVFSMNLGSLRTKLEENEEFKRSILDEAPERIDLKETTRKYVEAISRVHDSARKLVEQSLAGARSTIDNALSRYSMESGGDVLGVYVFCMSDEDDELDEVPVMVEWDDIRVQLVKRNALLINLGKRYVSSRIRPIH